jgi:hypothetical protein
MSKAMRQKFVKAKRASNQLVGVHKHARACSMLLSMLESAYYPHT